MEPVSFAISIASLSALFETCLRGFEIFEQGRDFGRSYTILLTRLDAQKILFHIWGEAVGLGLEGQSVSLQRLALQNNTAVLRLIHQHLECIRMIFEDADQLRRRYGVVKSKSWRSKISSAVGIAHSVDTKVPLRKYVSWFQGQSSFTTKARWAIQDQAKFKAMLDDLSTLLQELREITSAIADIQRQRNRFAEEIDDCELIEDLEIIEEALSEEDPVLSSVASERRMALTEAAMSVRNDKRWHDDGSDLITHADLDATAQRLSDEFDSSLPPEDYYEPHSSVVNIYGYQNNLTVTQANDEVSISRGDYATDDLHPRTARRIQHELVRMGGGASETPFISLGVRGNRIVGIDLLKNY